MWKRWRRTTAVWAGLGLAVLLALTVKFYRNPFDPLDAGRWPVSGQYVGQTKTSLHDRFGPPSHEREGYYGNPEADYARQHSPSVTATYIRSTGVLHLGFESVDGVWVCYSSDWMPSGWGF